MGIIITTVAAVVFGALIGWKLRALCDHADLNHRYRRSVRIAARSYKRRKNNGRPRKVHTAGDDYAV